MGTMEHLYTLRVEKLSRVCDAMEYNVFYRGKKKLLKISNEVQIVTPKSELQSAIRYEVFKTVQLIDKEIEHENRGE